MTITMTWDWFLNTSTLEFASLQTTLQKDSK